MFLFGLFCMLLIANLSKSFDNGLATKGTFKTINKRKNIASEIKIAMLWSFNSLIVEMLVNIETIRETMIAEKMCPVIIVAIASLRLFGEEGSLSGESSSYYTDYVSTSGEQFLHCGAFCYVFSLWLSA